MMAMSPKGRSSNDNNGGSGSSSALFRLILLSLATAYILLMVATLQHYQSLVNDQSPQSKTAAPEVEK